MININHCPRAWCATATDSDTGEMTSWAYCDETCPGVQPSVATNYVHPDNTAGQCCESLQEFSIDLLMLF